MFIMQPRQHARYRAVDGAKWDMRHYDDDAIQFTETERDILWTRTAITDGCYESAEAAAAELDRIETQNAPQTTEVA